MGKYLLSSEKEKLHSLIETLSRVLKVDSINLSGIEQKLNYIIKNNRDGSIEDILNSYYNLLELEMITLLNKKITPSMQFGIKNNLFSVIGYGGNYNGVFNSKEIDENTYFSFDSISKLLVSVMMMIVIREGNINLDSPVCSYNSSFNMDASIESILKFTAMIQTEKRIENLSKNDTISILKKCKENIQDKEKIKNYYQYNDIGYMILRLSIEDFLTRLDYVLDLIDKNNLTYNNVINTNNITGGRLGEEYITPDTKGRGILFPGHTGLYGNITGLLNLFEKVFDREIILTSKEKVFLLRQPFEDPVVYAKDGSQLMGKNGSLQYIAKVSGVYRKPTGINNHDYDKLASCDLSNLTTDKAIAGAGTCGSWVMIDNLSYRDRFGTYVGGILTNPYSYVEVKDYPNSRNIIPNTELIVNQKGIVLDYSSNLNPYKEKIAEYGILLELLTEYIKNTDNNFINGKKYQLTRKVN